MNKLVFCVIITSLIFGCSLQKGRLAREVNPFVGTGFHGHTYPGATVPFGAVQLSPDTRKNDWDACAGYHYSDSLISGFSHTHLSGTGSISEISSFIRQVGHWIRNKEGTGFRRFPFPIGRNGHLQAIIK